MPALKKYYPTDLFIRCGFSSDMVVVIKRSNVIVVVEVEGYCGLCYNMHRITFRFQVLDIFNFFFFLHLMDTVWQMTSPQGAHLSYLELYIITIWCRDLKCPNANSTLRGNKSNK